MALPSQDKFVLRQLTDSQVPSGLRGPFIVDDRYNLPRYWATVWTSMASSGMAVSTQIKRLRYVESLYCHADGLFGACSLDDALGDLDEARLAEILESWFISIRNRAAPTSADETRWRTGLLFVTTVVTWLSKTNLPIEKLRRIDGQLHRLSTLYGQLHIRKGKQASQIRSLPAVVIEALYEMLDPESQTNPFSRDHARWLAFIAFMLMLHQGLRRGELMLLSADVINTAFDDRQQRARHWLNVSNSKYADDEIDSRYSRPSIKSANAVRQLPVSKSLARVVQSYVENYRGKPAHPFLLNTQQNTPLSTESLTKIFAKISASLPRSVIKELADRNGRSAVTPHDLRHTCAVVRLNQLLSQGDSMEEALQKLRAFFGWSRESQMPIRYARAVFEDRLSTVWNDAMDERVAVLRAIP